MPPIQFLLLLMPLIASSTQGFLTKKIHAGENVNNGGTYLENIQTIVQDVKDALNLKKQTVTDAVSGVANKKFGVIKDIKDSKKNLVEGILASKIAKVNAMKTAKEDFMKTIIGQKQPLFFFHNKPHQIQDATTSPPVDGLKNRFFNFFLQFFDKFQGHFKKDKKFHKNSNDVPLAPISYSSTDSFPQVQEIAAGAQDSEPQINFFPSGSSPMEAEYPVAEPTSAPIEYVKPIHSPYEFAPMEDVHSGFQPSQFAGSSDYDKPKDDFAASEYPAVDFTNHQMNSHVRSPYYDSYPTSVKTARGIYETLN